MKDQYGRDINYMRVSITDRCNLRCRYCMPEGIEWLPMEQILTLEEITEVMSKVSLKHLDAPCIIYNLNNYYDSLKALLDHMIETGLSTPARQEGIYFADNLDEIRTILKI